jgi:dynein heavy chain
VHVALDEASNISTYLKALRPYVERLKETEDFYELTNIFPVMVHTIVLIWEHSKYYNVPTRLTVLLREICNDVIEQVMFTP